QPLQHSYGIPIRSHVVEPNPFVKAPCRIVICDAQRDRIICRPQHCNKSLKKRSAYATASMLWQYSDCKLWYVVTHISIAFLGSSKDADPHCSDCFVVIWIYRDQALISAATPPFNIPSYFRPGHHTSVE